MLTGYVQNWEGVVTAIGSLSTAASVMVAFVLYQRSHDQSRFSDFRRRLTELKTTVNEVDASLTERALSIVADRIAEEVCRIASPTGNYDEVKAFLMMEDNHNRLVQAVYRGLDGSQLVDRLDAFRRMTDLTVNQFIGQFPVVMRMISAFSSVTIKAGTGLVRAKVYLQPLSNKEIMAQVFRRVEAGGKPTVHDLNLELIDAISVIPVGILQDAGQKMIDECKSGMFLLVDKLVETPDSNLRALEARDRRNQRKVRSMETLSEELKVNSRYVRHMLSGSERARLDAIIAKLSGILES